MEVASQGPQRPPGNTADRPDLSPSIPTIVVHHSEVRRAGLIRWLSNTRFQIIASGPDLRDVPKAAAQGVEQRVILVGLNQQAPELVNETAALKAQQEGLRAVVLSDRSDADELLAAISAGFDAYLLYDQLTAELLVNALDLICQGQIILPHALGQLIRRRNHDRAGDSTSRPAVATPVRTPMNGLNGRLSDRELLVARRLMWGASNKRIARDLSLAEATIKVHVKTILRKIGARNRTQAAVWAANHLDDAI